jgi:hypothetical protein
MVDDLIDFCTNLSAKNGVLSTSASGTYKNELYTCSSPVTIFASHKGSIELTVAPALEATNGTFKFNSGSDTSTKTVSGKTTITINESNLTKSGNLYQISFALSNIIVLRAKYNFIPSTIYSSVTNSRRLDWSNTGVSATSVLGLSGSYNNYNTLEGYHQLKADSCYPYVYPLGYPGDVTAIFEAKSSFVPGFVMPEYSVNDPAISANGSIRLFSPLRRLSAYKYCYMKPYSTIYDNAANLISTDFTIPINSVLYNAGYQKNNETSNAAIRAVTTEVCKKLKTDYPGNIRIYVIKYKKQAQYKSFPFYEVSTSNSAHDYSSVDSCATSKSEPYLYDVANEEELKAALNKIAENIKGADFANYSKAKNVP